MAEIPPITDKRKRESVIHWWEKIFGVPVTEKIFFAQHLGVMLKAGISLAQALQTLAAQTSNKKMKRVLTNIASRTNEGQSFAQSLALYPNIFEELFVNMIQAGEVSGKYEEVLSELHTQLKKSHELKGKIKGAMIYPTVILIAMASIGTAMMVFVVPKLITIFDEANAELPLPTRILIAVTNGFMKYGIIASVILVAVIIGTIFIFKQEKPKYFLHTVLLKLPLFGAIIKKINLARLARTLASLLKTDIPIIKSLLIASRVVNNRLYREALEGASGSVQKGQTINSALVKTPMLFPPMVTQMVMVGEETGSLDSILTELADFFEEDVRQIMNNLPSVIEPILIILLGIGVGSMAVALIMPLYSITEAI